jgi:hypothetical protein
MMLAGREVPMTPWLPLAYFWQDVLVAFLFGVGERLIRRPALTWTCYGVLVCYVALNVPISLEFVSADADDVARGRAVHSRTHCRGPDVAQRQRVAIVVLIAVRCTVVDAVAAVGAPGLAIFGAPGL